MESATDQVFLIPDIQADNRLYIFAGARPLSRIPISVKGYRLWGILKYIDDCTAPFSIFALPSEKKTCKLFPVTFPDGVPDLRSLGFSSNPTKSGIVLTLDEENLWDISSKNDCIPIPHSDWASIKSTLRLNSALFRTSIAHSISKETIRSSSDIAAFESEFNRLYKTSTSLQQSLSTVFSRTFRALLLFGFADVLPSSKIQVPQLSFLTSSSGTEPFFSFGAIAPMIVAYNKYCSSVPQSETARISPTNYHLLMQSVELISALLSSLGYTVKKSEEPSADLFEAVSAFQSQNELEENGICNQNTISKLWYSSLAVSIEATSILEKAGFLQLENAPKNVLLPCPTDQSSGQNEFHQKLCEAISYLPSPEGSRYYLSESAEKNLRSISLKCVALNSRIETIEREIIYAKSSLLMIAESTAKADSLLDASSNSISEVHRAHTDVQTQFIVIKTAILSQRKIRRVVSFVTIVALLIYFIFRSKMK